MTPYFFLASAAPFFYLLTFPLPSFFSLQEDSLCQIAYWKILLHPPLAGSIAVSVPKAGMILTLGPLYELVGSAVTPSPLLLAWHAFLGAAWIVVIAQIAHDSGGWRAALLAGGASIALGTVSHELLQGSSFLYFGPAFLMGVRSHAQGSERRAIAFFCVASLFRIEGIAALAALTLSGVFQRRRALACLGALSTVTCLVVFFGLAYLVQGSWRRVDAGLAAGYSYHYARTFGPAEVKLMLDRLLQTRAFALFAVPAAIAVSRGKVSRSFLLLLTPLTVIVLNRCLLSGGLRGPYFLYLVAATIALGSASLAALLNRRVSPVWLAILFLLIGAEYDRRRSEAVTPVAAAALYSQSLAFLADSPAPRGSRILIDDEIASPLLVLSPGFAAGIVALQAFNVASPSTRREILEKVDYIGLWKNDSEYNYINYLPIPAWNEDPFRKALQTAWYTGRPQEIYGRRLVPWEKKRDRFLLKVER